MAVDSSVAGAQRSTRGKIVMLVDNGVNGDSRVQKEARSAAAAGWDVVLLGKSPTKREQSWRLGDAEVRLLHVPTPMHRRRHEYRRAVLRSPLAYKPGPLAAYRKQRMKAWRTELNIRLIQAGRQGSALGKLKLMPPRFVSRVMSKWVGLRVKQTTALEQRRKDMQSPLDRFTTAFWLRTMGDRAWRGSTRRCGTWSSLTARSSTPSSPT